MTAVILNLAPEQVILAMDTLAVTSETKSPFFFTTKFYPLAHLHGVMFATGLGDFATQWFVKLGMLRSTCCAAAASRNLHGTQRYLLKTT